MNYIIYDLEFNQKNNASTETYNNSIETEINNNCSIPFEIIQIGALKLNENFQLISTFNMLIKPTIYKSIHPFVENLTKITDDMVASCKDFIHVYEDFLKFIGNDEITLCVWGAADIKELVRNLKFHNLSTSYVPKYFDIQKYASKYLKAPEKSRIGLRNAIELLNIPIEGEFHDAFNDAYYTAEIFKLIYNDNIKPMIYTPASPRRISQPKEKIDILSLINQFEKMYNREMSEEEKSIIKLAYMMGKTRQFIL
ncbi:exonuclease [Clostridium gelidum]|uniref:Exonuclease n=1 Tax=Clostridium gelidum TaxID=704125 RepID=A0ABM7T9M2_9CLOT|nr:3'-5' exonuclease [Clostridium gelidum]BCZ45646.1 exonuclease [Clostridium gelidum]